MKVVYGNAPDQPKTGVTVNIRLSTRLMYKADNTIYLIGSNVGTQFLESSFDFDASHFMSMFGNRDGYYYADHYHRRGGYLGTDWLNACQCLNKLGLTVSQ